METNKSKGQQARFVLGIDVDGVCADFIGACAFLEEILTGYQYDRKLYHALNPIPYAASTLCALAHAVKIAYITARPMFARTEDWLVRHGFPAGRVINVRNGSKVAAAKREKVGLFVEDRPCYANPLAEAGVNVVLLDVYDRQLGRLHEDITVVSCWRAITRLMRKRIGAGA